MVRATRAVDRERWLAELLGDMAPIDPAEVARRPCAPRAPAARGGGGGGPG
jgi:hypothetical protein